MNSLILSVFVVIVAVFHRAMNSRIRKGEVKTGLCAVWCIDTIFAVCGTVVSFMLYHYIFLPYLTMRNILLILMYLVITILFVLLAPTGISLLTKKNTLSKEELLVAEYRMNDILSVVRNCFLVLLFVLPLLFAPVIREWDRFGILSLWKEDEVCGGFCFTAFLILVPISLRQSLFWLKNLTDPNEAAEEKLLTRYRGKTHYRGRNYRL